MILKFGNVLTEKYLEQSFVMPVVYILFPLVCTYINVYICVLYCVGVELGSNTCTAVVYDLI